MFVEPIVKGRSLGGSSDLTIIAPLKPGLVPSLDAITYKTRTKRLLKALHRGRASSHEYALARPLSDAVERVGRIQSVRVAVLEPADTVLLSVSFDGAWESYLRVIWQKVGTLLDLIFCSTVDYVFAAHSTFEAWRDWVVSHQAETDFFYGPPAAGTVSDLLYARAAVLANASQTAAPGEAPAAQGNEADAACTRFAARDLDAARASVPTAEARARDLLRVPVGDGFPAGHIELAKQSLTSLVGLYALTDWFLPRTADGRCLHRASRLLLTEFVDLYEKKRIHDEVNRQIDRFGAALRWLTQAPAGPERSVPPPALAPLRSEEIQAGILSAYPAGYSHGALLLLGFADAGAAARFLAAIEPTIAREGEPGARATMRTLALTVDGLRAAGLGEPELRMFPIEFVQGMAARAGLLGDVRTNHPRRWNLPRRVDTTTLRPIPGTSIEWTQVHAVLQLRARPADAAASETVDLEEPLHPLHDAVKDLATDLANQGVHLLAVQSMRRHVDKHTQRTKEHFGYIDEGGQPDVDGDRSKADPVHPGEFVIGYDNAADAAKPLGLGLAPEERERREWLNDGSFLVVRKISQDVALFDELVPDADVRAKLMGRRLDGSALVNEPDDKTNDFDYKGDRRGEACPFHAHIRRANPREFPSPTPAPEPPGVRPARLLRRGMSYGPAYVRPATDPAQHALNAAPRGLVFMAFNASIGEQFEVVQRWLVAGNSTGSTSLVPDPFVGVPENGERRWFPYIDGGTVRRVQLDGADQPFAPPRLLTRLEWGAYLFVPSLRAIRKLAAQAQRSAATPAVAWSAARGAEAIERLRRIESAEGPAAARDAWKAALEDPEAIDRFDAASIWAAIRTLHGGSLKTPYGVLVADRDTFERVLGESGAERCSVRGYLPRMHESIGPIFLGLDDEGEGKDYRKASAAIDAAIMEIPREGAFEDASKAAHAALDKLIGMAQVELAYENGESFDLHIDLRELVEQSLATLCEWWFALEAGPHWERGALRSDWQPGEPLRYPGHFTAPSRYIFQPNPDEAVAELAREFGTALRQQMLRDIAQVRARGAKSGNQIGKRLVAAIAGTPNKPFEDATASRNMVGVLMGFLPTTDGALRRLLAQWLADGTFWTLRTAVQARTPGTLQAFEALIGPALRTTLALRPAPEMIWRTATCPHRLAGASTVDENEKIVLGIASATQQALASGASDEAALMPMFGGARAAASGAWPTHACPGFEAAMGVLYGVAAALLRKDVELRAGPSPTSLTLTYRSRAIPSLAEMTGITLRLDVPADRSLLQARRSEALADTLQEFSVTKASAMSLLNRPVDAITSGHSGRLAVWGDSWVFWLHGLSADLAEGLKRAGYALTVHESDLAMTVADMADQASRPTNPFLDDLARALKKEATRPKAVVLSAGGNDCKGSALAALLRPHGNNPPKYFVNGEPATFVDGLLSHYVTIIDRLIAIPHFGQTPIIVHGYGRPVPDGRGIGLLKSGWLWQPITDKGYAWETDGVEIMAELIDRLNNDVMKELQNRYPTIVRYVDLRGELSNTLAGDDYQKDWFNELHPTGAGYAKIAEAMAKVIER